MRYRDLLLPVLGLALLDGAAWAQLVCRSSPALVNGEQLGCSVAASGSATAYGANLGNGTRGSVLVSGQAERLTVNDGAPGDQFGFATALDGNRLAVGAPTADDRGCQDAGAVYVFLRSENGWALEEKLTGDGSAGAQFGFTVALHGNTLAVGAAMDSGGGSLSGAVYIFELVNERWAQQKKFSGARPFDGLGSATALDEGIVAAGAPFSDGRAGGNQGAVHLFRRSGNTWGQTDVLTAPGAAAGDQFGYAVAIQGNTLAAGARRGDVEGRFDAGWVAVFQRTGGTWRQGARLTAGDTFQAGQLFGNAVALSGQRLLVGASQENAGHGAAYLFQQTAAGGWFLVKRMEPPSSLGPGRFGFAVAISGETISIGAFMANLGAGFVCDVVPDLELRINDISMDEGNSGSRPFTFTVRLSAPAPADGVTFDIATEDGTAKAGDDYVAKSMKGQIPPGGTTYAFSVMVKGDVSPESDKTFRVNLTNVQGASTTAPIQGVGTIRNDDFPSLTISDSSLNEGNSGIQVFAFIVRLSSPAGEGGVSFDIATFPRTATADTDYVTHSLTGQTIPAGSSTYTFDVPVKGDTTPETDETFVVKVTNATRATVADGQGLGRIQTDDLTIIHDVQGRGPRTPIPLITLVTVEGVVTASFQGTDKMQGFFLQEEDADADADPVTSEGIFVFCGTCPRPVAEGQRVRATGSVSEISGMTTIVVLTAPEVEIDDPGSHLAEVTPAPVDLPVSGRVNAFYEEREGMLVTFVDRLTIADHLGLARFGQIELFEGGRPRHFTETALPDPAGYSAYLAKLARRRVLLDDDDNAPSSQLVLPDGRQFVFHPQAKGGFSIGAQGTDFFRSGDVVSSLTGVLSWSSAGVSGTHAWRIRPTAARPVTFTVANPRPVAPPPVDGAVKAASVNFLNYFTTIDTVASSSPGPYGPAANQDRRGADSMTELNRQRERASIVICGLNAHVFALTELENTTPTNTINDLLGAVNARCGGANSYTFVNTGGTLGTSAIRVAIIFRSETLLPVGPAIVDLDPIHDQPPTAQTFEVINPANPALGKRFTVVANHFRSRLCDTAATGADADAADGQACYAGRRTSQSRRLLAWLDYAIPPEMDLLLLGDFNSYAQETPVATLKAAGFADLAATILSPAGYADLFNGQSQVTGVGIWRINADESDLFDYNDEVKDAGEAASEEKPDGSALSPPRTLFLPASPYRASAHDPVLVGLFPLALVSGTKSDSGPRVTDGSVTYTVVLTNAGFQAQGNNSGNEFFDVLPAELSLLSAAASSGVATPTLATNTVAWNGSLSPGASVTITITAGINPEVTAGTIISNQGTIFYDSDGNGANDASSMTDDPDVGGPSDPTMFEVDPEPVPISAHGQAGRRRWREE